MSTKKRNEQDHGRHRLAGRLLRLPHVLPRHGRAPDRAGQRDGHRLQPLVDTKVLPERVDVGILEGSISNEEDLHKAQDFRKHCKLLISLGDCAVNGNVPAMRNQFKLDDVIDRAYRRT
jgi:coenzyme F420-reducing hydrogenase gamma subunit